MLQILWWYKIFEKWLQAIGKLDYVKGKKRPKIDCIMCGIRDNDERVEHLKVYQDDKILIVLNLYPYNPAHMMVIPTRHVTHFEELTKEEIIHCFRAIQGIQLMLNDLYAPFGYNMGMNQGRNAGASIEHIHFHILPRYDSELGYIDIIGHARVLPEGLTSVKKKIDESISKYLNKEFFKEF